MYSTANFKTIISFIPTDLPELSNKQMWALQDAIENAYNKGLVDGAVNAKTAVQKFMDYASHLAE